MHIFWQKRIRQGDVSTPWWFPSKTDAGAIREDRIVLPIPPDVRWSDLMPRILPEDRHEGTACPEQRRREALRHEGAERSNPKQIESRKSEGSKSKLTEPAPKRILNGWGFAPPAPKRNAFARNGMWYDIPKQPATGAMVVATAQEVQAIEKTPRVKAPRSKIKADPKLIAMARELRDRWLEEVNSGEYRIEPAGKYEIGRGPVGPVLPAGRLLNAA